MNAIARFSLEAHVGPYKKWSLKSRLLQDGKPTGTSLAGYSLLHQFVRVLSSRGPGRRTGRADRVIRSAMPSADFDQLLKTAIRQKRLVAFILDQRPRLAEPHDYGLIDGEPRLFFYQVGGESRSGRPVGWRWAVLSKISELHVLDQRFGGSRPVPSGKHVRWDALFATVSPRRSETHEA